MRMYTERMDIEENKNMCKENDNKIFFLYNNNGIYGNKEKFN